MSTLTTLKILTDGTFQHLPPRPFIRFYARILSFSAADGSLKLQELPAFMVNFSQGSQGSQQQDSQGNNNTQKSAELLPEITLLLPPSGIDIEMAHDTIRHQLVVSVMGFLEPSSTATGSVIVTAHSVKPLSNQRLFDIGYADDKYSSTVLEKIQVVRHISMYSWKKKKIEKKTQVSLQQSFYGPIYN